VEFAEVLRRRRMVRRYDPDRLVPTAARDRLLAAALRAPSAGFAQGWGFLVLSAAADRQRFWTACVDDGEEPDSWLSDMSTAPMLVLCLSNKGRYLDRYAERDKGWADRDESRWPVPYWDIDTGFAALLMLLDAVDQELGACFFGIPPERIPAVLATFGIPPDYQPIGVVSVGYPVPDRRSPSLRRGHRPLDEVVHHGTWGTPTREPTREHRDA
jgi:nitroreductase